MRLRISLCSIWGYYSQLQTPRTAVCIHMNYDKYLCTDVSFLVSYYKDHTGLLPSFTYKLPNQQKETAFLSLSTHMNFPLQGTCAAKSDAISMENNVTNYSPVSASVHSLPVHLVFLELLLFLLCLPALLSKVVAHSQSHLSQAALYLGIS